MTGDEVIEAMAEALTASAAEMGIALSGHMARPLVCAAIRAMSPRWVVTHAPEPMTRDIPLRIPTYEDGFNDCLVAVLVRAVMP